MKKRAQLKRLGLKKLGLIIIGLGAVISGNVLAVESQSLLETKKAHLRLDGGIKVISTQDDRFWFGIGGRFDIDSVLFSGSSQDKPASSPFPSGTQFRRAFLKFYGGLGDCFTYNFTPSFTGSTVQFEDAWVGYTGVQNTNLRVGQFTPPTTLSDFGNYGTDNDTMFLESSLATKAFGVPTKVLGIWADTHFWDMFMLSASVYHPEQPTTKALPDQFGSISNSNMTTSNSSNNYQNPNHSDRFGSSLRLVLAPIHQDCQVLHLGVLGRYQSMNTNMASNVAPFGTVAVQQPSLFFTTPEAMARNSYALVNTGPIRAKSYNVVAGEALGILGPWSLESEFFQANVHQRPTRAHFHGWHLQGGFVLTGESRGYDCATATLRNPLPERIGGALEIAARYSTIKLIHSNIYGGREMNVTLGINWFLNQHVKLAFNYIRAKISPTGIPAGGTTSILFPIPNPIPPLNKRELDIFGLRLSAAF